MRDTIRIRPATEADAAVLLVIYRPYVAIRVAHGVRVRCIVPREL